MEKREKPVDGDLFGWRAFERYADREGFGTYREDWLAWWECWQAGYSHAMNS